MNEVLATKLERVRTVIRGYGSALVCFSGGVDSTLVLKLAKDELNVSCYALTCVSETMARSEREEAVGLGQELGLGARHIIKSSAELARPGFAMNPLDRCYLCKSELFAIAGPVAREHGLAHVILGTNADDLHDHRPGLKAAEEHGARHPLVEAELAKAEVRELSRALGLRTWNKPQLACLSSRFPYGTEITLEKLTRVDRFEDGLRALGFRQLRVRFHDPVARLEVDDLEHAIALRERIVTLGRELGFAFVAVDLAGYRTGSLNVVTSEGRP